MSDTMTPDKPQAWSDERIGKEAYDEFHLYADHTCPDGVEVKLRCTPTIYCADLMRKVRDDMQSEIARLEAEVSRLRALTVWQPLENGKVLREKFGDDFEVTGNGSELTMASKSTVIWADLPDDIRLCRKVEAAHVDQR